MCFIYVVDPVLACALSPMVFELESLQENQEKHYPDVLNLAKNIGSLELTYLTLSMSARAG